MGLKDNWIEQFRKNLNHHLKRINYWHELKLKHQDGKLTLERKRIDTRTFFVTGSTIVLVHDSNLH